MIYSKLYDLLNNCCVGYPQLIANTFFLAWVYMQYKD